MILPVEGINGKHALSNEQCIGHRQLKGEELIRDIHESIDN